MIRARFSGALWLLIPCLLMASGGLAQTPDPAKRGEPIAFVAGRPLYRDDLRPLIQAQLQQLRNEEYKLESQALDRLVNEKLLEAEAKKKGIPADKLLEQEVNSKAAEPTEGELQAYYLGKKDRLNRPFEEIKPQLQQSLKQARLQQARQDYLNRLREQNGVTILLRPPKIEVAYDAARLRGEPKAPVVIVEFSDFQCPYCKRVQPVLKDLLAKYGAQVSLAFRDFPLRDIHPQAQLAAEASRCAGEQGRFWEYHDLLFANREKLDRESLFERARSLKLNEKQLDSCLATGKYRAQIEADLQEGERLGVSGTPGFFINGIYLNGAQPEAAFEKIIQSELGMPRDTRPQVPSPQR